MKAFPSKRPVIKHLGKFGPIDFEPQFYDGMDLRDYFAAQAMQALLSQGTSPANSKALAIVVYDVADKMMEERNIK